MIRRVVAAASMSTAIVLAVAALWKVSESDAVSVPFPSRSEQGEVLVAALVVSPNCSRSDAEDIRDAWNALLHTLQQDEQAASKRLHTIAVSVDNDPDEAVSFLRRFGRFDEIAVGGGWFNTAVLSYVVRDVAGQAFVPQVVLVSRDIGDAVNLRVSDDSLVVRLYGAEGVHRWIQRHERGRDSRDQSNLHSLPFSDAK